jgi:para-nitrobenzyl esterase
MTIAHTALGDLRGSAENGVVNFRAVPYAAPPVGERRFAPPAPHPRWNGLRDATQHGPIAPQLPSRLGAAMGNYTRPQSEDCLTLTIATPAPDARARPVLVWLHGGAWITGAGSLDWYDGATLAREGDLVFVGVNHRLGALGFLHHPAIAPANLGQLDQIAALNWVHEHIAAFGGDASRVTVMGQSAGGTAIGRLLLDPATRGLFRRGIIQSGSFGRPGITMADGVRRAETFMRLLDIDPDAADAVARMRALPPARILEAQVAFGRTLARFGAIASLFAPLLPEPMPQPALLDAIAAGAADKDIIVGATREEVHAFFAIDPALENPDPARVAERFAQVAGAANAIERYRARRPGGSAMDLLADLVSDDVFLWPSFRLADAMAQHGARVFGYRFDWSPPNSRFNACHCIDLPFAFGTLGAWPDAAMLAGGNAAQMQALSALVRRAWISFTCDGDPASPNLPWPRYDADRRAALLFDAVCDLTADPAGLGWRT